MALLPLIVVAEEYNIGSYTDLTNGKSYAVDVRLKDNKIDLVYIFLSTKSGVSGYFCFKGKDLNNFYNTLHEIGVKYTEWSNTAKDNHIVAFSKDFGYELPKGTLFWIGNKTWMAVRQRITPVFVVSESLPMIVFVGSAKALQNKYVTETFSAVFTNLKDFENFTRIFNPETALKKALETQNLTDKFK